MNRAERRLNKKHGISEGYELVDGALETSKMIQAVKDKGKISLSASLLESRKKGEDFYLWLASIPDNQLIENLKFWRHCNADSPHTPETTDFLGAALILLGAKSFSNEAAHRASIDLRFLFMQELIDRKGLLNDC